MIKEKLATFLATFVLGAAVAALGQSTGSSGTSAGETLPMLLEGLRARGFKMVDVTQLLKSAQHVNR